MKTFAIRPYHLGDVDEVFAAADESREHVGPWMGWLTPAYGRAEAQAWVESCVSRNAEGLAYECLIVDAETGAVAGSCGLNSWNKVNGFCNLGYWVRKSCLRQGAARQAVLLLREHGFQALGFNRLEIVAAVENEASAAVARSVGALYEGVQKKRLMVGATVHDCHMFALLRE
jgi:ribosomal-protein-serine acetyltransferase